MMKKSNRLSVKVMALLLACIMVIGCASTAFAGMVSVTQTEYYELSYNTDSDVPEVVVTVNAEKLGNMLAEGNFTKAELAKFCPDFLLEVIETRSLPSLETLIDLIPTEVMSSAELGKLIPGNLLRQFVALDKEFVDSVLGAGTWDSAISSAVNDDALNTLATPENGVELYNAGVITDDALLELTGLDSLENASSIAEVFELVDPADLAALLETKKDDVIETLGLNNILDAIGGVDAVITNLGGYDAIIANADKAVLKNLAKDILIKVIAQGYVTELSLTTLGGTEVVFANTDDGLTAYVDALAKTTLCMLPTASTLASAGDNATVFVLSADMKFNTNETSGVSLIVKLEGDTTKINAYANELAKMINYSVDNDGTVNLTITDAEASIAFADIFTKALNSDRLTDAEKVNILSLFTKTDDELLAALKALDFSKWINDATQVSYLTTIRDEVADVLAKLLENVDGIAGIKLSDFYQGNGLIEMAKTASVATQPIKDAICNILGLDVFPFSIADTIDFSAKLALEMKDVYRIRFYTQVGSSYVLYETLLPAGTDLSFITDNAVNLDPDTQWFDADGNVVTTMPAADTDLFAKLPVTPVGKFTATFIADGKVVAKVNFNEGDTKLSNVPKVPDKIGYFGKWENYSLQDKDLTIKALYTAKTYTIVYKANGGEGTMTNQILTYDKETALNACAFTRDGYTFLGWNTEADGTGTFYADQQLVKNMTIVDGVTLYAQWQVVAANVHTATFIANGSVVAKVTFEEGATELSTVPTVPARVGYTGAWEAYTLGTEDITVNAIYTANTYTVVFNANGGSGATVPAQTMTYDELTALTANTYTKAGYTFAGWNTEADGSGTSYANGEKVKNLAESGEVTLYAQWEEEVASSETTTAPVVDPVDDGFNWLLLVLIIVAVLAVGGGVGAYFVLKNKKS